MTSSKDNRNAKEIGDEALDDIAAGKGSDSFDNPIISFDNPIISFDNPIISKEKKTDGKR